MSLGEHIYRLRTEKHLSQGDLAGLLEVSRQSVSKWENDGAVPDLDKLMKMSEIFDISLDELVKGKKSDTVSSEADTKKHKDRENNSFPPRKIAGTILLCMAFICVVIFGLAGLIIGLPFVACGAICFAFQRNVGLWCTWTVYFLLDIYLSFATGITRSSVLRTFQWTADMNYARLAFAWIMLISLIGIIGCTVVRFKNHFMDKNGKSRRKLMISWLIFAVLQVMSFIWPYTKFYGFLLANILSMNAVYRIISLIFEWSRIVALTIALCNTWNCLETIKSLIWSS